jgi:hypothetical protein
MFYSCLFRIYVNMILSPVRTFNTACVYYHKFRLTHNDTEYNYVVSVITGKSLACSFPDFFFDI